MLIWLILQYSCSLNLDLEVCGALYKKITKLKWLAFSSFIVVCWLLYVNIDFACVLVKVCSGEISWTTGVIFWASGNCGTEVHWLSTEGSLYGCSAAICKYLVFVFAGWNERWSFLLQLHHGIIRLQGSFAVSWILCSKFLVSELEIEQWNSSNWNISKYC